MVRMVSQAWPPHRFLRSDLPGTSLLTSPARDLVSDGKSFQQDVKPYYDLHSPSQIKRAINKGVLASDDDELRLVSFSSTQRDGGLQLRSRGTHDFIALFVFGAVPRPGLN